MDTTCIFCKPEREILLESEDCFAIFDKYPVSPGHILVILRQHEPDYFSLSQDQKAALWDMVDKAKSFLDTNYKPDGYNVGFNLNKSAGQTIFHVHIHVIPRYAGDMKDPTGGVRHAIEGKGRY